MWIRIGDEYDGKLQTKWKFLSECYKPEADEDDKGESGILFRPSPGGQPNLQLRTFKFIEAKKTSNLGLTLL